MTNLSDLLPSGGSAKEATAIASGTLSNGQTVALRSDGKVEAITQTNQAIGSPNSWSPAGSNPTFSSTPYGSVYDPDSEKVIVAYRDGNNSNFGYCAVGEVDPSNNTITFGTPVIFQSNFVIPHSVGYDTTNDKVVIFSQNINAGSAGQAKVGVVSGNSISFPTSPTAFNGSSTEDITAVFNPDQGVFLVAFKNNGNNGRPTGAVGTVSGTSISFGSTQQFDSINGTYLALTYNTTTSRYLLLYNDTQFTNLSYQMPTTSGSTVTAGSAAFVPLNGSNTVQGNYTNLVSDDASNTVFIVTANTQNNTYISAIAATVPSSGNTLTFGTENFFAGNTVPTTVSAVFDKGARKLVVSYVSNNNATVVAASFVGTTLTFGSPNTWRFLATNYLTNVYDDSNDRVVISYIETNTTTAASVVFKPVSTNVANFIGITSQSITSGNSGKYNPQGGVATTSEQSAGETGTPTAFTGGLTSADMKAVFDSGSNQVVFGFQNPSTGYGTSIVGAINSSNNTVSFGASAAYQSLSSSYNSITYDASADKIVAITADSTNSYYWGTAYVGTVSGTGISFTSGVVYHYTNVSTQDICYDSTNQTVVVTWTLPANNNGESAIGTISGGAITFGSRTLFESNGNSISYINNTFDSNAGSVVVAYQMAGFGLCVVAGQKSNTVMSWGSRVVPHTGLVNSTMSEGGTICFDSQNNKVVVPHKNGSTTYGNVVVCDVSGTTVTGGTPVPFTDVEINGGSLQSTFDSNLNKVIIAYVNQSDFFLKIVTGTVSGTSITFDTPIAVTSTAVNPSSVSIAFDSNTNKTMVGYNDNSASAAYGAVYVTTGTQSPLTIDSTYYIQNNGNITTTATGNTEIGKAVSTTQLLLKGAS